MSNDTTTDITLKKPASTSKAPASSNAAASTHQTIPPKALDSFKKQVYGSVVSPEDADYVAAKTDVNMAYVTQPILVVFCTCLGDVRASLKLASEYNIPAVARSGRHSLAGYSGNDGLVLDVSQMNGVNVNYAEKTATVGPGTQFGKLNACLQSYGLHVPGGGCPTVAVAGYMQGGGYGFTSREFGMHCDNVLSFTMVLANQKVVEASAEKNADLFWAVRGGTGNQFGILLEVRFKLVELGDIGGVRLGWSLTTHAAQAAEALLAIQNNYINSDQYNHLGFQTAIAHDDKLGITLNFCAVFNGTEEQLDAALEPLTSLAGCEKLIRIRGEYSTVDETLLARIPDIDKPMKAMTRSCYIDRDLEAEDYRKILDFALTYPDKLMIIDMEGYGGKIRETAPDAMAFMHREAKFDLFCDVFWNTDETGTTQTEWLESLMQMMESFSNGHSYQNYPCRLQKDWRWAYFGKYYNTLLWVKQKFDPNNFFSFQQSITPQPAGLPERQYAPLLFDNHAIIYEPY